MPPPSSESPRAQETSFLANLVWNGFKLGFGLTSLAAVWTSAALKDGTLWARDTKDEKEELAAAQQKYWSLDHEPLPGFKHAFFKTSTGASLHYIVNADVETSKGKNVAIFIHGFPDSYLLWRHMLKSPELQRNYMLIAVDLPGYGGSDSPTAYGPNELLGALSEYIIGMRMHYLKKDRRVIAVTHDWGAIIGARLASEAGVLADHWIITSGVIPQLLRYNAAANWAIASQMLHTWIRQPLNIRLLKNALNALSPVTSQFRRSFYIFCFGLPWPFNRFFATFGNYWFLRTLHSLGKGNAKKGEHLLSRLDAKEAGESMAMSAGPGLPQLQQTGTKDEPLKYGESVRRRVSDRGMSEKLRIYREGLFMDRWEKSLEITAALFDLSNNAKLPRHSSSASSQYLDTSQEAQLQAPATLICGEFDPAFESRLALSQIKESFSAGGQALLVKGAGHWLPIEPTGRRVLEKTVLWALGETENDSPTKPFATMGDVKMVAEA